MESLELKSTEIIKDEIEARKSSGMGIAEWGLRSGVITEAIRKAGATITRKRYAG